MSGPTAILDKSAFQGLSRDEHTLFYMWFMENLTPVLVFEIQGDLTKQARKGPVGPAKLQQLASKFGGSGGVVNLDYPTLARQSLLGAEVPMTGQIIPHEAKTHYSESLRGRTAYIDLSPLNHAILRWSRGEITSTDTAMSSLWRNIAHNLSISELQRQLNSRDVILPRPASADGIVPTADSVLHEPGLQEVLLLWVMNQLAMSAASRASVLACWRQRPAFTLLRRFAPYAHHCLRALLALLVAVRHGFITRKPTNLINLQYLFYLPFCQVFVSDDKVHRLLAPGLMRRNQLFIGGVEPKRDLARMKREMDALPESDERRAMYGDTRFPPQPEGSVVQLAWDRCMRAGGFGPDED